MSPEDRLEELKVWAAAMRGEGAQRRYETAILEFLLWDRAALLAFQEGAERRREEADRAVGEAEQVKEEASRVGERLEAAVREAERRRKEAEGLEAELGLVYRSRTWRLRNHLLAIPGAGRLIRWAARRGRSSS